MRFENVATALILVASTVLTTACSTTRFDELYEARDYAAAARAFEADPSLYDDARALFRAGMIHATPNSPTYDPGAARPLLERLVIRHPDSDYAELARRTLAFLNEIHRLEDDVLRLAAEAGTLSVEVERLNALIDRLDGRSDEQADQIELLGQIVQRLEIEIRNRDTRIRALQDELDQLKAIDLRPSRPTIATPDRPAPGDTANTRGKAGGDTDTPRAPRDKAMPDSVMPPTRPPASPADTGVPDSVVQDTVVRDTTTRGPQLDG